MPDNARLAIMISGRGSNMAALIKACKNGNLAADVVKVIADKANAPGLKTARELDIEAVAIERQKYGSKFLHEQKILCELNAVSPDFICLAGYMRILSPDFVRQYENKILNIHPSLLPKYTGLNTHERVLAAGDSIHGATVHFVTDGLDEGPVVAQSQVSVSPDDDVRSLEEKVLNIEHALYIEAVRKILNDRAQSEKCEPVFR